LVKGLKIDFEQMSIDDLWQLREEISLVLQNKINTEKEKLEERLASLARNTGVGGSHIRRPYPKVIPKYRNPSNPAETWSGRGRQPAWVVAELNSGKKLDDLAI
jgi:DNA-binding protein H-NS